VGPGSETVGPEAAAPEAIGPEAIGTEATSRRNPATVAGPTAIASAAGAAHTQ
jgi:hypothetical protein